MDGDAETLGVASSLGIAGEDGRFATRMTGAFTDFSLGKGDDGTDRGRSLRVSTRQLVSGPSARAAACSGLTACIFKAAALRVCSVIRCDVFIS